MTLQKLRRKLLILLGPIRLWGKLQLARGFSPASAEGAVRPSPESLAQETRPRVGASLPPRARTARLQTSPAPRQTNPTAQATAARAKTNPTPARPARPAPCQTNPTRRRRSSSPRRGGALLAVLWLSAALSAIAFSVASTVRVETDRASTLADSVRAGYLASGAIETSILRLQSARNAGRPFPPRFRFSFASGESVVEVIPESSRLNLNTARPPDLQSLLLSLGARPEQAATITAAIIDWRQPGAGALDAYYGSLVPSFRARHASFQEIEEALWVQGMTPDLFHGSYARHPRTGRLVRLGAFKDCVSIYGSADRFDANGIDPALLVALGVAREQAEAFVLEREKAPFLNSAELARVAPLLGPAMPRLTLMPNSMFTLRASARVRLPNGNLSEVARTVSALVKFRMPNYPPAYQIMRWNDQAFSPAYSETRAWR